MLPRLLALAGTPAANTPVGRALAALRRWNYQYSADAIGPSLFEIWYNELVKHLWDDDFGKKATGLEMRPPARDRTNNLILKEDNSRWIDDRRTLEHETLPLLARQSLDFAVDSLTRKFGPLSPKWRWASQKGTDVVHLLKLKGFGHMDVDCGGGAGIVNATSERNGPSWRMVVALGPQVRAYGLFPGGQSGNPGSVYYDNMLENWRVGKLDELVFLRSAAEPNARVQASWTLRE
jgi:penicillin amidase